MTAVEWLVLNLNKQEWFTYKQKQCIEQAKEMEKQQIIDAWIAEDNILQKLAAEQYYNETFKKTS